MEHKKSTRIFVTVSILLLLAGGVFADDQALSCTVATLGVSDLMDLAMRVVNHPAVTDKQAELDRLAGEVVALRDQMTDEQWEDAQYVFSQIASVNVLENRLLTLATPTLQTPSTAETGIEQQPLREQFSIPITTDVPHRIFQHGTANVLLMGDIADAVRDIDELDNFLANQKGSLTMLANPETNELIISSLPDLHVRTLEKLGVYMSAMSPDYQGFIRVRLLGGLGTGPQISYYGKMVDPALLIYVTDSFYATERAHEYEGAIVQESEQFDKLMHLLSELGIREEKPVGLIDVLADSVEQTTFGALIPAVQPSPITLPEDVPSVQVERGGVTITVVGTLPGDKRNEFSAENFDLFDSILAKSDQYAWMLVNTETKDIVISYLPEIRTHSALARTVGVEVTTGNFGNWKRMLLKGGMDRGRVTRSIFERAKNEVVYRFKKLFRDFFKSEPLRLPASRKKTVDFLVYEPGDNPEINDAYSQEGVIVMDSPELELSAQLLIDAGFAVDKDVRLSYVYKDRIDETTLGRLTPTELSIVIPENIKHRVIEHNDIKLIFVGTEAESINPDNIQESLDDFFKHHSPVTTLVNENAGEFIFSTLGGGHASTWRKLGNKFLIAPDFGEWKRMTISGGLQKGPEGIFFDPPAIQRYVGSDSGSFYYTDEPKRRALQMLHELGFALDKPVLEIYTSEGNWGPRIRKPLSDYLRDPEKKREAPDQNTYFFGEGTAEGLFDESKDAIDALKYKTGGKHAASAANALLGLPVPAGFAVSAKFQKAFEDAEGNKLSEPTEEWNTVFETDVQESLSRLEQTVEATLGDANNPLITSVRSGAAVSMPGLLETILNFGMTDQVTTKLAEENPSFAWDSYRRFMESYGRVALDISKPTLDAAAQPVLEQYGATRIQELYDNPVALQQLVSAYKTLYVNQGHDEIVNALEEGSREQLVGLLKKAMEAVYNSWYNDKALFARNRQKGKFRGVVGTAVIVQQMVFGNKNQNSASGVAFTRHASTGKDEFYGDWKEATQGEDVVSGAVSGRDISELQTMFPEAFAQLEDIKRKLEATRKRPQDIEFTIEDGELYLLQSRDAFPGMAPIGRIHATYDFAEAELIDEAEAFSITKPIIGSLLFPKLTNLEKYAQNVVAEGTGVFPATVTGATVVIKETWRGNPEQFERELDAILARANEGRSPNNQITQVILVTTDTMPDDLQFVLNDRVAGMLTQQGGKASHAALVARGNNVPLVSGFADMPIGTTSFSLEGRTYEDGSIITLSSTWEQGQDVGRVIEGEIAVEDLEVPQVDIPEELESWEQIRHVIASANP